MSILKFIRNVIGWAGLFIIFVGIISYYLIFSYFVNKSTDETLTDQMIGVQMHVERFDTLILIENPALEPMRIEKREVPKWDVAPKEYFKDTLLYEERTGTFGSYRQLYFPVNFKNKDYMVNINQPSLASSDLSNAAIASICIFIILFLLFMSYLSSIIKKRMWEPLAKNADAMEYYDLKANSQIDLSNFGFREFDQIFDATRKMVDKINRDYENTRYFTEDISHEMQTPLSIMISKLDLFAQTNTFDSEEKKIKAINTLRRAVVRLSKLNKSLLLISKINNDQFPTTGMINIKTILDVFIQDSEELLEINSLNLTLELTDCNIVISQEVAEFLISNLLSNAIRHNIPNGWIRITLINNKLTVFNSCNPLILSKQDDLFLRMLVKGKSKNSSGLGLNIVKTICDKNNLPVIYKVVNEVEFEITVDFNKA